MCALRVKGNDSPLPNITSRSKGVINCKHKALCLAQQIIIVIVILESSEAQSFVVFGDMVG